MGESLEAKAETQYMRIVIFARKSDWKERERKVVYIGFTCSGVLYNAFLVAPSENYL